MKKTIGAALLATLILVLPSITFADTSSTRQTYNDSLRAVIALLIQEVQQLEAQLAQQAVLAPQVLATSTQSVVVPDNSVNNLLGGVEQATTTVSVTWESVVQAEQVSMTSSSLYVWYESKQHIPFDDATFVIDGNSYSLGINEIGPALNGNWYYVASTTITGLDAGQTYNYTKQVTSGNDIAAETGSITL